MFSYLVSMTTSRGFSRPRGHFLLSHQMALRLLLVSLLFAFFAVSVSVQPPFSFLPESATSVCHQGEEEYLSSMIPRTVKAIQRIQQSPKWGGYIAPLMPQDSKELDPFLALVHHHHSFNHGEVRPLLFLSGGASETQKMFVYFREVDSRRTRTGGSRP